MKEKCPLCGNDKEPTGMQLLCHPPITEMACRKCQPGKFPYINFDVKRHDEAALKQPVWDGTGLPPVGVECEWCESNGQWTTVKIVYLSEWVIVMRGVKEGLGKGVEIAKDLVMDKVPEFRPIRSERDEAVLQMLIDVKDIATEQAEALYDAGYRKLSD